MPSLREWFARLWSTFGAGRRDADLESELRLHMEMAAEAEQRRRGSVEAARESAAINEPARRRAAINAGGLTQAMEELRDQRGLPWLAGLARDLRYGLRVLARNPLFASVSRSHARARHRRKHGDLFDRRCGPAANTARRQAARSRGVPAADSSRSRHLSLHLRGCHGSRRRAVGTLGSGGVPSCRRNARRRQRRRRARADAGRIGQLLRGPRRHGTSLTHAHAAGSRTAGRDQPSLLAAAIWRRPERGRPDGRTPGTCLHGRGCDTSRVLRHPTGPLRRRHHTAGRADYDDAPDARWLYLIARLAPGVAREQAQAALRLRWARLMAASPPARRAVTLELDSGAQGLNELRRQFSLPLRILMAAVGVVLLVACANLAGLMIVRSSARQHEIAIRLSIGAARWHIVRRVPTSTPGSCRRHRRRGRRALADRPAVRAVPRTRPDRFGCRAERADAGVCGCGDARHGRPVGLLPYTSASRTSLQTRLRASTAATRRVPTSGHARSSRRRSRCSSCCWRLPASFTRTL